MMNRNGYQNYKQQTIMTMTQGELLLALYDELLKRLRAAELGIDNQDFKLFDASVERCSDIVYYLKNTLNFEYAISNELNRMYDFFLYEISRLKAGRRKQTIEDLKGLVKELREAFGEAEKRV